VPDDLPTLPDDLPTLPDDLPSLPDLVREGVLDAQLAALCWLMVEGGVPVVVTGTLELDDRRALADILVHLPPVGPALIVDLDAGQASVTTLASFMRAGMRLAAVAGAPGLRELVERATAEPTSLPEDAVRRLGLVLVVDVVPSVTPGPITERVRIVAAHYLRPLERDGGGHVQRRPPAVLATWDPSSDAFDHFAWGVTSELADRVNRSQDSFEDLQVSREAGLAALAQGLPDAASLEEVLAAEPARVPAPPRAAATPSPVQAPLTEPHVH
jgi:hypothetical protein